MKKITYLIVGFVAAMVAMMLLCNAEPAMGKVAYLLANIGGVACAALSSASFLQVFDGKKKSYAKVR